MRKTIWKSILLIAMLIYFSSFTVFAKDTKGSVLLSIKDEELGKELKNASMVLKDSDGKEIDKWVSDGGAHRINGLELDKEYTLENISPPEGYLKKEDVIIYLASNSEDTVDGIYEMYIPFNPNCLTVTAYDTIDNAFIPGTRFDIIYFKDADKKEIIKSVSLTEQKREIETYRLKTGNYILRQTEAPDGYKIMDDIPFEVKGGEEIGTIRSGVSRSSGRIHLSLIDEKSKEAVIGYFDIYNEEKHLIEGGLTTDENGFAESGALEVGTYEEGKMVEVHKYLLIQTGTDENKYEYAKEPYMINFAEKGLETRDGFIWKDLDITNTLIINSETKQEPMTEEEKNDAINEITGAGTKNFIDKVKTGDNQAIVVLFVILSASAVVIAGCIRHRRKERKVRKI